MYLKYYVNYNDDSFEFIYFFGNFFQENENLFYRISMKYFLFL